MTMDHLTDDGDLHVCGYCKQSFERLDQWLEHKQMQWCKAQYLRRDLTHGNSSMAPTSKQGGLHNPLHAGSPNPSVIGHDQTAHSGRIDSNHLTANMTTTTGQEVLSATPIKRSLYPIMPPNRKRERVRSRKQESPQPLIKREDYSPTPSTSESMIPVSPGSDADQDNIESSIYKRPRGRPRKESTLSVIVSPASTSSPSISGYMFSPEQSSNDISHSRRPLVLPRVYSCPRCSKSFIKLSHLHRHMNKKKPCEAKDSADAVEDNSDPEEIVSLPSDVSFTCGLCSEQYHSYDDIMSHHSEKHPAYYPGYCRFCGKFQDRKNKLLIHLVKHDHAQIVDEVAQEVKRIRHTKIDKPSPASHLSLTTAAAIPNTPHTQTPLMDLMCSCCLSQFPDKDELLCHFRDFHSPIGCHVTESDIMYLMESKSSGTQGQQLASAEKNSCFICCLRFTDRLSLESHIDLHKVWTEAVEPVLNIKQPLQPDQLYKTDENRNTQKLSLSVVRLAGGSGDSESNNNSEDVMDLSLGNKKVDGYHLSTAPQLESNGSPEETVSLDFPCWLCTDQHSDIESWREHIKHTHKIHLVYRCPGEDCRKEFDAWDDLCEHGIEHAQQSFVCKVCNDHQPTKILLARHSKKHAMNRRLPSLCQHCECLIQEDMQLHKTTCAQQLVHCTECNDKVKRLSLMKHMLNHSATSSKTYRCDQCDSMFPLKDRLSQHAKNVHGPRKFVCTDCGAAFKRNDKLQRHCQSRHSDLKPYLCPIVSCGRAFKRIDGLRAHVRCSHVTEALAHEVNNHYGCTVCGKLVSGQEHLVDHLMSHVKANPPSVMSSSLSGELFGSMDADSAVLAATSTIKHYECPHCHIKIPTEQLFYAHLVQHSQVAFQPPALPFSTGFFFPLGQSTASPVPKKE